MLGSPPQQHWRVPKADWDRAPWNRWSFQHVREILPTVAVYRAASAWEFETSFEDVGGIDFEAADGTRSSVETMLDDTYTDGFAVIRGGKLVHESYYNGMNPRRLHLAHSVSKSVVASVAGILIGRGMLDPEAPVTKYLPELRETAWRGASLRHILDMTSGVRFDEEYTSTDSDIAKTDVACGWKLKPENTGPDEVWPTDIWSQILSLKTQEVEHGSRFSYRSIETDVLAHAMERASGRRLATLVGEELWSRIGTDEDACFTVDSTGYALADGGFNATLRDFARFGLLLLNGGKYGAEQIIPADWIADIRHGDHGLFNDDAREMLPNGVYRNQFWIEDSARETIICLGVFGQMIYVSPEYDMVVVKLSSWPDFLNSELQANTLCAIHAIAQNLG